MQEQKVAMEQATQGTGVSASQTPDNQLKLEIPSDISFDTNRYVIKPNLRPILDRCRDAGCYAIYWSLRNPVALEMMRSANFHASLSLYGMCGILWLYRGNIGQLFSDVKSQFKLLRSLK